MFKSLAGALLSALLLAGAAAGGEPTQASTTEPPTDLFEHIAPLVGTTWRAEGVGENGEAVVDVARWEWILGGRAVRVVHSINDGAYGGQSTIYFDPAEEVYRQHYVTTGGFRTEGILHVENEAMIGVEVVAGHPTISRVRSRSELVDGVLHVRSEYLENGEWTEGHGFEYRPAPEVEPIFPPVR